MSTYQDKKQKNAQPTKHLPYFCSSSNSEDYAKLGPAPVKDLTNKYLGGPWNNAVYKVNR